MNSASATCQKLCYKTEPQQDPPRELHLFAISYDYYERFTAVSGALPYFVMLGSVSELGAATPMNLMPRHWHAKVVINEFKSSKIVCGWSLLAGVVGLAYWVVGHKFA